MNYDSAKKSWEENILPFEQQTLIRPSTGSG